MKSSELRLLIKGCIREFLIMESDLPLSSSPDNPYTPSEQGSISVCAWCCQEFGLECVDEKLPQNLHFTHGICARHAKEIIPTANISKGKGAPDMKEFGPPPQITKE